MRQITYDVLVKYKGYNGINITLPVIGTIYLEGDDNILIKGATAGIIEALRQLSSIKVKIEIVTGWTKLDLPGLQVIEVKDEEEQLKSVIKEAISEITPSEEVVENTINEVSDAVDNAPAQESVETEEGGEVEETVDTNARKEELANYELSKGPLKGKKLSEFSLETLEARFNTIPKVDKPTVEEYINLLKGE